MITRYTVIMYSSEENVCTDCGEVSIPNYRLIKTAHGGFWIEDFFLCEKCYLKYLMDDSYLM